MFNFLTQIDLRKLIQKDYLLEITPSTDGFFKYLVIIFGLFITVAVYLIIRKPPEIYKKYFVKLINLFLVTGVVGLMLIFFRWQATPYMGSRVVFLSFLISIFVWLLFILWYRFFIFSKEIQEKIEKENFEKYLPRR